MYGWKKIDKHVFVLIQKLVGSNGRDGVYWQLTT